MAKIGNKTNPRQVTRLAKKLRIKKKIDRHKGSIARLVFYRSNKFLYAQVVDDLKGQTLAQATTREAELKSESKKDTDAAKALGTLLGKRALDKKVERVLFDRNGYEYHGRVKAFADAAREAGLKF